MKDKRTYTHLKEHGEDMTHENESKITVDPNYKEDINPSAITLLTEQYRTDLKKYQDRESLYISTENQLKGAKQIAVDMANAVTKLDRTNLELMKEIDRLNEEIQLLELKIKK
jgi:hypothetical protein